MTKPTSTVIAEIGQGDSLPALLDRAASALAAARTSGEVLEARDLAAVAYDAAKSAGRMARAKQAHDDVIGAVYRAQADAALIEARAKIRLADEYDAAQKRGEVATRQHNPGSVGHVPEQNMPATAADIGLSRKEIHEARTLRDAEKEQPGIIEKTVADRVEAGQEPTKAAIKKAAQEASGRKLKKPARTLEAAALPGEQMDADDELAEAHHTIADLAAEVDQLRDQLAIKHMDASEAEKQHAAGTIADLRRQVKALEEENAALKVSRDTYMQKCAEMQKQINYWRREAEKRAAA